MAPTSVFDSTWSRYFLGANNLVTPLPGWVEGDIRPMAEMGRKLPQALSGTAEHLLERCDEQ